MATSIGTRKRFLVLRTAVVWLLSLQRTCSAEFEPYQLNGGLVAAVAGRDYVVLSSDTRLMGPGGYDLLERNHIASRLWAATDSTASKNGIFKADGSVSLISKDRNSDKSETDADLRNISKTILSQAPVLVASAGCNTDCEQLKRLLRADLRAAHYWSECQPHPTQIATLLSQMLYSRRGFPFYSFCVVGGLGENGGQAFVYDAIGSYEQVAVATSGTGRELLQPILDRQFRTLVVRQHLDVKKVTHERTAKLIGEKSTPVTQVDCSKEEAVSLLVDAYRSVSEREIGVGDKLALCVLQRLPDRKVECQVLSVPLKKH